MNLKIYFYLVHRHLRCCYKSEADKKAAAAERKAKKRAADKKAMGIPVRQKFSNNTFNTWYSLYIFWQFLCLYRSENAERQKENNKERMREIWGKLAFCWWNCSKVRKGKVPRRIRQEKKSLRTKEWDTRRKEISVGEGQGEQTKKELGLIWSSLPMGRKKRNLGNKPAQRYWTCLYEWTRENCCRKVL